MFQRKTNPQSGFAIGLILLAVVLIAAIVAAIASSSRDSGSSADKEQIRLQANRILLQADALTNAAKSFLANNYGTTADLDDPNADLVGNGIIDDLPVAAQVNAALGTWDFVAGATASDPAYLVLTGLPSDATGDICEMVNSIIYSIPAVHGDPGTIAAGDFDTTAPAEDDIVAGATAAGTERDGCAATSQTFYRRIR